MQGREDYCGGTVEAGKSLTSLSVTDLAAAGKGMNNECVEVHEWAKIAPQ